MGLRPHNAASAWPTARPTANYSRILFGGKFRLSKGQKFSGPQKLFEEVEILFREIVYLLGVRFIMFRVCVYKWRVINIKFRERVYKWGDINIKFRERDYKWSGINIRFRERVYKWSDRNINATIL